MKAKLVSGITAEDLTKSLSGVISPLQWPEWGEVKRAQGWRPYSVGFFSGCRMVAWALLLEKKIPIFGRPLLFVLHGPVFCQDIINKKALVQEILGLLRDIGFQKKAFCLRIHPYLPEDLGQVFWEAAQSVGFKKALKEASFRSTVTIDLKGNEEDILKSLRQRTRRDIRKAERELLAKPHSIVISQNPSRDEMRHFYRTHVETYQRTGMRPFPWELFESILDNLSPRGLMRLAYITIEETMASAAIVLCGSKVWLYMYGASSGEKRLNRFNPGQLLHWNIAREAKRAGATTYDLGGIPNDPPKGSKKWGIYLFKTGFSTRQTCLVGTFDFIYNEPLALLVDKVIDMKIKREIWSKG